MKKILIAVAIYSTIAAFPTSATATSEKYAHFPAVESTDIASAFCNIQTYNAKLNALLAKESLSAEDMVKIHELTYTLENALNLLKATLETTSVKLEEVHKASERLDKKVINESGEVYLNNTAEIIKAPSCR